MRHILLAVILGSTVLAQDSPERPRWDTKMFGVILEKPAKGTRWVIAHAIPGSEGSKLERGDEVLKIDGKNITTEDDAIGLLKAGGDTIKIRAKRMVANERNGKTKAVYDETTFTRMAYFDIMSKHFKIETDELTDIEVWRHIYADEYKSRTGFTPSIAIVDGRKVIRMHFRYRSKSWLFVRKITFKHGDRQWEIDVNSISDVKREVLDGGIYEWFIAVEPWCKEVIDAVSKDVEAKSIIRLHGDKYIHDHTLTPDEVYVFHEVSVMLELLNQKN
jgi:hypothetical protein